MNRHLKERGQAITEFVISLIPLMLVFAGVMFMAVMGYSRVRAVIEARGKVDESTAEGSVFSGTPAEYISSSGNATSLPEFYDTSQDSLTENEIDNSGVTDRRSRSYFVMPTSFKLSDLYEKNYTSMDFGGVSMLDAASLSGVNYSDANPLAKYNMTYLGLLLKSNTGADLSLNESVFMPSRTK